MIIELHISEAAQASLRQFAAMTARSIDDLVRETVEHLMRTLFRIDCTDLM
jgi:hypothetical protein